MGVSVWTVYEYYLNQEYENKTNPLNEMQHLIATFQLFNGSLTFVQSAFYVFIKKSPT